MPGSNCKVRQRYFTVLSLATRRLKRRYQARVRLNGRNFRVFEASVEADEEGRWPPDGCCTRESELSHQPVLELQSRSQATIADTRTVSRQIDTIRKVLRALTTPWPLRPAAAQRARHPGRRPVLACPRGASSAGDAPFGLPSIPAQPYITLNRFANRPRI